MKWRVSRLNLWNGAKTAAPSEQEVEIEMSWQLGATPSSAWLLLLILSGLFSVDWMLRKKWGMV